jgi:hypothetical protein
MRNFVRSLLPCQHDKTSRVFHMRTHDGKLLQAKYIVCTDCAKQFAYDWDKMQRGGVIRRRIA